MRVADNLLIGICVTGSITTHLQRIKPSSTQERYLFGSGRGILEQIAGISSLVTISIVVKKKLNRQWSEIFPAAFLRNFCSYSLAFFSILLP